jgi:hypothetical protein
MSGMVLGDITSQRDFIWLLNLPTWEIDVDGLAYPLHRPTAYNRQARGHGLLSGFVLSRRCSGRRRLFGDVKPPGLDI